VREVRDFSRKENENLAFSHGKAAGTGGKRKPRTDIRGSFLRSSCEMVSRFPSVEGS